MCTDQKKATAERKKLKIKVKLQADAVALYTTIIRDTSMLPVLSAKRFVILFSQASDRLTLDRQHNQIPHYLGHFYRLSIYSPV